MTINPNEVGHLVAMYAASQKRLRARLVGLGVPPTDVEDLRQEVFVVALRRRAQLSNEDAAAAWLNQACEFVALAHRRKAYRRREVQRQVPESEPEASPQLAVSPEPDASDRPAETLHRALSALEPLERDLLALHLAADVPFRTLAQLHRCDVKTVRKRFQSAAKRLRGILEAETPGAAAATLPQLAAASASRTGQRPHESLALRRLGANSSVAIGAVGNVLITCWRGAFTAEALELLLEAGETLMQQSGSRIACLGVVEASWPVPLFEERQRIFQALDFLRQSCLALSLFGLHSNLRLAEQIMRGLGFLLQAGYPLAASADLHEAAAWLLARDALEQGTDRVSVEQLADAVRTTMRA